MAEPMVEIIAWSCETCGAWCDLERHERGGYEHKPDTEGAYRVVPARYVREKRLLCPACEDHERVLVATVPAEGPMR